jgi:hypothetical protein
MQKVSGEIHIEYLPNKEAYLRALITLGLAFVNYSQEYFVSARN